jgi:RimJ/RimL family protein N-acetyltransferase
MPARFPQIAVLRDGKKLLIRPFANQDADALYDFFQDLPMETRKFAWDDISNKGLIERWAQGIDYSKVLPLLALDGSTVVADATLHRRNSGPLRHVGRLKWLIGEDYRGQGLGTTLVNQFITIAREDGLRQLTCMLIGEAEADAIRTLKELGFDQYVIPEYGADPDGQAHDMVKLVLKL